MSVGAAVVLVRTAGVYNLFLPQLLTPQMRCFVSLFFWCELAGVRWARPHWVPEGGRAAQSHNAVIVMAPLLRVLSPEVREDWTLLGDDFSTVFPFLAQCLARQWLQDICSKVVAWHAAALGKCLRLLEKEKIQVRLDHACAC